MANQGKRLIPEDDLDYLQELKEAHADPSAEWGGGETFTAGEGITIESETISVNYGTGLTVDDETLIVDTTTIALKSELFSGDYDDLTNKPTIPTKTSDLTNNSGFITSSDIPAQVQANWNESDTTSKAYIQNKPIIPTNITDNDIILTHSGDSHKQIKITTMTGSTSGVQETGIRVYGTSDNSSTGTPMDTNLFEVRPSKATYRTKEVNFGTSASTVDKVTFSNNCDLYVGATTNKVLTTDNVGTYGVIPNPQTTTDTLTGLTIGGVNYSISGGGGSSYTFTNGLTESSGTVSWDLNDVITKQVNTANTNNSIYFGQFPGHTTNDAVIVMGNYSANSQSDMQTITNKQAGKGININAHNWASNANYLSGTGIVIGSANNLGGNSNLSGQLMVGRGLSTGNISADGVITLGQYNVQNSNAYLVIGNGTADNARSNALTVSKTGILECTNIPAVSGTDGTYQLTATTSSGTTTYSWASGGSGKYLHKVKIYFNISGTSLYFEDVFSSSSSTPYTSVDTFLTDRGYTVSSNTDQPTKRLETYATSAITALAYRTDQSAIATSTISINSSGVQTCSSWSVESNTPVIIDEVM